MSESKTGWDLPWPDLEIPAYGDSRVGQWFIKSASMLVHKGYFQKEVKGDLQSYTMFVRESENESVTVMSTLPMEVESNAPFVAAAKGVVVIMGAGMGLVIHNILKKPDVSRLVVVEQDPDVIQLLREATDIENWHGYEKLTMVNADAFEFMPEFKTDFLYVDIWDDMGNENALSHTRDIQRNVNADMVGWWTQEIEFLRWMHLKRLELPPVIEQYQRWASEIQLPIIELDNPAAMSLIHHVAQNYPSLIGMEEEVDEPLCGKDCARPATSEGLLDTAQLPDGTEMALCQQGNEFGILVEGIELMSSETANSEKELARLACESLATGHDSPCVVIAGLGMGFSLRSALDVLPHDAQVTLVELVPAVVEWNRGPLGALSNFPLADCRVQVELQDIAAWIEQNNDPLDAIVLDVDNGPNALAMQSNRSLYDINSLLRIRQSLSKEGILATWSATRDREFEQRLAEAGFQNKIHQVPRNNAENSQDHIVYIAQPMEGK